MTDFSDILWHLLLRRHTHTIMVSKLMSKKREIMKIAENSAIAYQKYMSFLLSEPNYSLQYERYPVDTSSVRWNAFCKCHLWYVCLFSIKAQLLIITKPTQLICQLPSPHVICVKQNLFWPWLVIMVLEICWWV